MLSKDLIRMSSLRAEDGGIHFKEAVTPEGWLRGFFLRGDGS